MSRDDLALAWDMSELELGEAGVGNGIESQLDID